MNALLATLAVPLLLQSTEPSVDVVVEAAMVDAEALALRLDEEVRALVDVLPFGPGAGTETPLRVRIQVSGELLDFEVRLRLEPGRQRSVARCRCTRAELVTHVLRRMARSALHPTDRSPGPPPPPPPPRPAIVSTPVRPAAARTVSPSGVGAFGRAGAVLSLAGGFALGVGTGVLVTGRMASDERFDLHRDGRPIGVVTVVMGACIGLSGALLWAYGHHSRRSTGVAP